jgi:hypothetical protein
MKFEKKLNHETPENYRYFIVQPTQRFIAHLTVNVLSHSALTLYCRTTDKNDSQ